MNAIVINLFGEQKYLYNGYYSTIISISCLKTGISTIWSNMNKENNRWSV